MMGTIDRQKKAFSRHLWPRVVPRGRLDISPGDLWAGALACVTAWRHKRLTQQVATHFNAPHVQVYSSLRSGFAAMLRALKLPVGSEILLSCINIVQMAEILRQHGLVPIPIEVNPMTLAPQMASMARLRSPRTRAILVAHLLGAAVAMGALHRFARRHRLLLWEDCAQAFGVVWPRRKLQSDAIMFSFGPIKSTTALGGGVICLRAAKLAATMAQQPPAKPPPGRIDFLLRVARFGGMAWLGNRPCLFGLWVAAIRRRGGCHDTLLTRWARGSRNWGVGQRASAPMLALMRRRLRRHNPGQLKARRRLGRQISRALAPLPVVGAAVDDHSFWLVALRSANPAQLVANLLAAGFDASQGASKMAALGDCATPPPPQATSLMASIVYLPVYPGLAADDLARLVQVILASAASCQGR